MNEQTFDHFTRWAANAVSRRSSLATLGGATLAAGLLAPLAAEAKDNKAKKAKKKARKKARKKCKKQEGQCQAAVQAFCTSLITSIESVGDEGNFIQACVQQISGCCGFFASCNAEQGVQCVLERSRIKKVVAI